MPLIRGYNYQNPAGAALPAVPIATAAPSLAPAQGDHLFGDVLGTIETSLQWIFGGGALWQNRMERYRSTLRTIWNGLRAVDFGHGTNPPVVQRNGTPEPAEHAHMFGGYSARLQWNLCEIVCTGWQQGGEVRMIGGATRAWKSSVLGSFDDLMNHLVDSTALAFYIATPNATRTANPPAVRHPAISLQIACNNTRMQNGPGTARVQAVLNAYAGLRNAVTGLLDRLDGSKKTLDLSSNAVAVWV